MKTKLCILVALSFIFNSFGQQIFTGSVMIEEEEYAGVSTALPQTSMATLPRTVDLSKYLPPVGDQGNQQSCVAFAIAYGAQAYYAKRGNDNWNFTNNSGQINYENLFSPSFIYNQINRKVDEGSNYIDALNLLKEQGVSTWSLMPYSDRDYLSQPLPKATKEAGNFKIERYFRLGERQDLFSDIKEQLANSHPIVASAISDVNYLRNGNGHNSSNLYLWQTIGSHNPKMGHAILIVGYDDNIQAFKFLNSYGDKWGNNGFGWISYSIFNGIIKYAFTMKPSFSNIQIENNKIAENRNNINKEDINWGLNLSVTNVLHMNTITHPYINPRNMFMTVSGQVSVPPNIGNSALIVIYYYLVEPNGNRIALPGFLPAFTLQTGQAMSATTPISTKQGVSNFLWKSDVPYIAFPQFASNSTFPITYIVEAEPALIVDNFSVRIGTTFRFTVTQ